MECIKATCSPGAQCYNPEPSSGSWAELESGQLREAHLIHAAIGAM